MNKYIFALTLSSFTAGVVLMALVGAISYAEPLTRIIFPALLLVLNVLTATVCISGLREREKEAEAGNGKMATSIAP